MYDYNSMSEEEKVALKWFMGANLPIANVARFLTTLMPQPLAKKLNPEKIMKIIVKLYRLELNRINNK